MGIINHEHKHTTTLSTAASSIAVNSDVTLIVHSNPTSESVTLMDGAEASLGNMPETQVISFNATSPPQWMIDFIGDYLTVLNAEQGGTSPYINMSAGDFCSIFLTGRSCGFGTHVQLSSDGKLFIVSIPKFVYYDTNLGAAGAINPSQSKYGGVVLVLELDDHSAGYSSGDRWDIAYNCFISDVGISAIYNGFSTGDNQFPTSMSCVGREVAGSHYPATTHYTLALGSAQSAVDLNEDTTIQLNETAVGIAAIYQTSVNSTNSWEQKGATIYGDDAGMQFGFSISLNHTGDMVAVSAVYAIQGAAGQTPGVPGEVHVLEFASSDWALMANGTITATVAEAYTYFGQTVALETSHNDDSSSPVYSYLAVGEALYNLNLSYAHGRVYAYSMVAGGADPFDWVVMPDMDIEPFIEAISPDIETYTGYVLDITAENDDAPHPNSSQGMRLIFSSMGHDIPPAINAGKVLVADFVSSMKHTGNLNEGESNQQYVYGTWSTSYILPPSASEGSRVHFGSNLALSRDGSTIVTTSNPTPSPPLFHPNLIQPQIFVFEGVPFSFHDPYVIPKYGNKYKLPNIEENYRLYERGDIYINAYVKKADSKKQQAILNYVESMYAKKAAIFTVEEASKLLSLDNLILDGYFYDKFFISSENHELHIDLNTRNFKTNSQNTNYFTIKQDTKKNTSISANNKCVTVNISWNHTKYGKIRAVIAFFENPQIDNGIKLYARYNQSCVGLLYCNYKPKLMRIPTLTTLKYKKLHKRLRNAKNKFITKDVILSNEKWLTIGNTVTNKTKL
jgi:hypothetical protein